MSKEKLIFDVEEPESEIRKKAPGRRGKKFKIHPESFTTDGFPDVNEIFGRESLHLSEKALWAMAFAGDKLSQDVADIIDRHLNSMCQGECAEKIEKLKKYGDDPEKPLLPFEQ